MISPVPAFSEKNVPVVFASDENYIPYVAVAIKSIINHASNDWNYDILLLTDGETIRREHELQSLAKDRNNISIRMVDMSDFADYAKSLHIFSHVSYTAYYRLFISELCTKYDKIIYMDCDVLCVGDIAGLYAMDLGNHYVAAAHDEAVRNLSYEWIDNACEYIKTIGMKDPKQCFNSGVLLMNLELIRKENVTKEFKRVARVNKKYWHDQSVLNICCQGRVLYIPEKWNYTSHMYVSVFMPQAMRREVARMNSEMDVMVIHYAASSKPWNKDSSELDYLWWRTAYQTPYMREFVDKALAPHLGCLHFKSWVKLALLVMLSLVIPSQANKRRRNEQTERIGRAAASIREWVDKWNSFIPAFANQNPIPSLFPIFVSKTK